MPGLFDFLFGEQKQPQPMGLWDPTLAAKFAPLKPYSPDPSQFIDQMRAGQTPGINPDAPQPMMPQPMMPFQPRQEGFIDRLGENPLFNIGLGLLGTGRFDTGLQQGLMAANQASDRKARRGLLDLQTQQYYTQMQDQQRKRQEAQRLREMLKGSAPTPGAAFEADAFARSGGGVGAPAQARNPLGLDPAMAARLAALPDDQLLSAASTLFTREPPKPINVNGRLVDPNDPSKVIADFRETPEEAAAKARATAQATAGINEPLVQVPDQTSPTGYRNVPRSQAVGQPATGPGGLMMEFGPDGRPTLIRSGGGVGGGANAVGAGLSKSTITDLEGQALAASNQLARLEQIGRGFKPEFLQFATRGAQWWSGVREKMGANLPEAERQQLAEFTSFKRDSVQNLNQTIKDITGAAMSLPEAERIKSQVPNAGVGIFDGDSPTEFKAKLDGATKDLRNAILRANWARSKGLDPLKTGVELSEVPALINKRGNEIAAEVKKANPNLDEQGLRQLVRMQLGREFGMLQ